MNRKSIIGLAVAGAIATSAAVMALVTFDPATGKGFVGKGDVQLVDGWNNKKLQDNAAFVEFRASSVVATATTWTCDKDTGPNTQERSNTTTTTTEGLVTTIARERNQITGFTLDGYDGDPVVSEEHDGPTVGSCPTGWTAIDLVEGPSVPSGGGLEVRSTGPNSFDWTHIYP
jgi:hypothetical protein